VECAGLCVALQPEVAAGQLLGQHTAAEQGQAGGQGREDHAGQLVGWLSHTSV
jgi:hypothetical protein